MKALFCGFLLLSNLIAIGQPLSKAAYVRGTFNYSYRLSDSPQGLNTVSQKSQSIDLAPGFGFCLSNQMILGISLRFATAVYNGNNSQNINTSYSTEAFFKYFIPLNTENKFHFSPEFRVSAGDNFNKTITPVKVYNNGEQQFIRTGLFACFSFYPTPKIGIEFIFGSLAYSMEQIESSNPTDPTSYRSHNINLNFDPRQINIGLSYLFR